MSARTDAINRLAVQLDRLSTSGVRLLAETVRDDERLDAVEARLARIEKVLLWAAGLVLAAVAGDILDLILTIT